MTGKPGILMATAVLVVGCAHAEDDANQGLTPFTAKEAAMIESVDTPTYVATVEIPLVIKPGNPNDKCSQIGFGSIGLGGPEGGSVTYTAGGNVNLSRVGDGAVHVKITAGSNVPGYLFWGYPQAPATDFIGLCAFQGGQKCTPVFGNWPSDGFGAPQFEDAGNSISFVDNDNTDNVLYEYSVRIAYFGQEKSGWCVLDPQITNRQPQR